ncbi:Uma2 family endonuclease [Streptomyces sp. NPDC086023]|uniref:Uma2 family endonuclease n=1 Tax=Streptomyces sp. NPDC086023 TaxID=3365746 RepID=UPI0037D40DF7
MSSTPDYNTGIDPESALKYALQHVRWDHAQLVDGVIEPVSRPWGAVHALAGLHDQPAVRVAELACLAGAGDLDLPGSLDWYVPDLAVVPGSLAHEAALQPRQTLLVVETADCPVKQRRYAEYGAPLYLLLDRQEETVTLFSGPGHLGYTAADGPHPFGTPVRLPAPFDLTLDTTWL